MFDAVPGGVLQLLRNAGIYGFHFPAAGSFNSQIFLREIDIAKRKCPNKYIRNCFQTTTLPLGQCFWNSLYGGINWQKAWMAGEKFC